jgi:hypothetical protein
MLTRRANQRHKHIIANIMKPARRNLRRAFSFWFFESDDGSASRRHISVPDAARRKRAVVRTTFNVDQPARANAPARGVAPMCHRRMRPPTIPGIRFAPK